MKWQAKDLSGWLKLQEERLAVTNQKRAKAGLSPATMNDMGYISAQRIKVTPKTAIAASPSISKVIDEQIAQVKKGDILRGDDFRVQYRKDLDSYHVGMGMFEGTQEKLLKEPELKDFLATKDPSKIRITKHKFEPVTTDPNPDVLSDDELKAAKNIMEGIKNEYDLNVVKIDLDNANKQVERWFPTKDHYEYDNTVYLVGLKHQKVFKKALELFQSKNTARSVKTNTRQAIAKSTSPSTKPKYKKGESIYGLGKITETFDHGDRGFQYQIGNDYYHERVLDGAKEAEFKKNWITPSRLNLIGRTTDFSKYPDKKLQDARKAIEDFTNLSANAEVYTKDGVLTNGVNAVNAEMKFLVEQGFYRERGGKGFTPKNAFLQTNLNHARELIDREIQKRMSQPSQAIAEKPQKSFYEQLTDRVAKEVLGKEKMRQAAKNSLNSVDNLSQFLQQDNTSGFDSVLVDIMTSDLENHGLYSPYFEKGEARAKFALNVASKMKKMVKDEKIDSSPSPRKPLALNDNSEYDFDDLGKAHTGFLRGTGEEIGNLYYKDYKRFIEDLESQLRQYTPKESQSAIDPSITNAKKVYFGLLDRIKKTAQGTYSSFVAGGAKFNKKQADRRGNAYDKATEEMKKGIEKIRVTALKSTGAQSEIERMEAEVRDREKASEAKAKDLFKKEQSQARKAPIINDPNYKNAKPITKQQWNAIQKDYKAIEVDQDTGMRYRATLEHGIVYLSDSPLSSPKSSQKKGNQRKDDQAIDKKEFSKTEGKAPPGFFEDTFPVEIDGKEYRVALNEMRDGAPLEEDYMFGFIQHKPTDERNRFEKRYTEYLIEPTDKTMKMTGLYHVYEKDEKGEWRPHVFDTFPTEYGSLMVLDEDEEFRAKLKKAVKEQLPAINSKILGGDFRKLKPIFLIRKRTEGSLPKDLSEHMDRFVAEIRKVADKRPDIIADVVKKLGGNDGAETVYLKNVIQKKLSPLSPETMQSPEAIVQRVVESIDKRKAKATLATKSERKTPPKPSL